MGLAVTREITRHTGQRAKSLAQAVAQRSAGRVQIAEINAAGALHPILSRLKGLHYSEFGSRDSSIPSESLEKLTYRDNQLDIVITSDTLEHVSDIHLALKETLRVLKPTGAHVFTVPVLWDRDSVRRATVQNGTIVHRLTPSYHGSYDERREDFIVFHEFGRDFPQMIEDAGFELSILSDKRNETLVAFIARKPGK